MGWVFFSLVFTVVVFVQRNLLFVQQLQQFFVDILNLMQIHKITNTVYFILAGKAALYGSISNPNTS